MAIITNNAVEFFGTQSALGTSSASVADAAFSIAGDLSTWVNDNDAITAAVVLSATFGVSPTANSSVALFLRPLAVDGANDQGIPNANFQHSYVGSFPVDAITAAQTVSIVISLPNILTSQNYEFYIQNNTGQTLSAGWDIDVNGKAIGPKA